MNYKDLFTSFLEREEITYTDVDKHKLVVSYSGENLKTIPIIVFFDKDDDPMVTLRCWDITKFKKDKVARGILACNLTNRKYRWIKFYIDDKLDVIAECDSFINMEDIGNSCLFLVKGMVKVVDESYTTFMEALWGGN